MTRDTRFLCPDVRHPLGLPRLSSNHCTVRPMRAFCSGTSVRRARLRRRLVIVGVSAGALAIVVAAPALAVPPGNGGKAADPPGHRSPDTTTTTTTQTTTTQTTTTAAVSPGDDAGAGTSTQPPGRKQRSAASSPGLTIVPITWDVVGLDSTDVNTGPNVFPVGVRVCATGGTVSDITVSFTWDSSNPYINLIGPATQTIVSLATGACADRYFFAEVTRDGAAYDTARAYHVTASAPGVASVSTPTPRQLYVERLLSQNRNQVQGITGPTTVYVGESVTYTMSASTSPGGYAQLVSFLDLLSPIFQLLTVDIQYGFPAGARSSSPYADACGWDADPNSPTYRSCVGPANFPGGRVGDSILGTFSGLVVGTGTATLSNAILDVSGSSYHYNADFGTAPNLLYVSALPSSDLALSKTAVGSFVAGGTGTYALTVTNLGPSPSGTPVTVTDTLPDGMTYASGSGVDWSCSAAGQTVTCTRTTSIPAGSQSLIALNVDISRTLLGTQVNMASVSSAAHDADPRNNMSSAAVAVVPSATTSDSKRASRSTGRSDSAAAGTFTTGLPVTGSNSMLLALMAVALIMVGGTAVRLGRGAEWTSSPID